MAEKVVLRFDEVTFEYEHKKPLLKDASFVVRSGAKITLMGQNGAGKSSLFSLIKGENEAKSGKIHIDAGSTVASANQVIKREEMDLTVREYFASAFEVEQKNLDSLIAKTLETVNMDIDTGFKVGDLSGGQQARLLLAHALIQNPDILLLDEPTNNLDKDGIDHLITFLIMYEKTAIVISHDADFLNCFTEGVIYLDIFSKKIETYVGDYFSVVEEISNRIKRERMKNAQLEKVIKDRKEKVNFFAQKGGKMRKLAKKMREETEVMEAEMVDVRKEDRTIKSFDIPAQDIAGEIVKITSIKAIKNHEPVSRDIDMILRKGDHMIVTGPNGIGKSTFLRSLVNGSNDGAKILDKVIVGNYSQDFASLDFNETVLESLSSAAADGIDEEEMRAVAGGFLIGSAQIDKRVYELSEGQKGLLSFARLVLMRPGLLILDEPSNHINFRHLPVIAKAIDKYEGTMIIVSHMDEFIEQLKIDQYLELGKI